MKFKINWQEAINLIIWIYKVVKEIIRAESYNVPSNQKHDYVKAKIMPLIKERGWSFTGDDVDKIINGVVWFIKKIVKSKNK